MKPLRLLLTAILALIVNTAHAAGTKFDCDDLGSLVDQGGVPEKTALWKLGPAPGYERTFTIAWDMYGIPDRMVVKYRDATGLKTFETGSVSYTGTHTFKLTANGSQDVKITMNPGDGISGTAWEYRMYQDGLNIEDITLASYSGDVNWRKLVNGTNLSADRPIVFDVFGQDAAEQKGPFIAKVFRVTIPGGLRAVRVRSAGSVQICMLKGCIPRPGQFVAGTASKNRSEANAIIFDDNAPIEPGIYYITASIPRNLAYAIAGFDGSPTLAVGNLSIDCFNTGRWSTAQHTTSTTRETERVLVGFEPSSGELGAVGGAVTIVSHGRTDSPAGKMLDLGNAATGRWGRATQYLNWSEASNSNPLLLDGTRFIPSASAKLAGLLRKYGIGGTTNIDYLGHSWGTYMGDALANRMGRFRRFFALDPALVGFQFNLVSVNFRTAARHSVGIYGNGLYGNGLLAMTAHDAVLFDPPLFTLPGTRHAEPVLFMTRLLAGTEPSAVQTAFAHTLGQDGAKWIDRLWDLDRYTDATAFSSLKLIRGYETIITTDGSGNASQMRYVDKTAPTTELIFQ